jgi:glycine/D-amino acid oxidase-like deaminating enzyme
MPKELLPSPDFTGKPRFVAGLRPYRRTSYRLETETLGSKLIVHNYGHGGAGITMSWGCALEVSDIVSRHLKDQRHTQIAVLGAGVMGLTAATALQEAGFQVRIYAKEFIPNTTSNVAGGQWAPSLVEYEESSAAKEQFHRILLRSFRAHEWRIGKGFGVIRRPNFTTAESKTFKKVPKEIIPGPKVWDHLPFKKFTDPGFEYSTLLVEPPIFLTRLQKDLKSSRVEFVQREFLGSDSVAQLREPVVVNSTGLGSRKIWNDSMLYPIKGQLAILPVQPQLRYLYSSGGYVFPRQDGVVLGGSTEHCEEDPTPDPDMGHKIIQVLKETFDGVKAFEIERPSWFMVDK